MVGTGPRTLVLVHGFGDDMSAFSGLLTTGVADQFRLLLVDLPGFGSRPARDGVLSIAKHGRFLAELIIRACPGSSVGLVGHSVGSMIAVEAIRHLGRGAAGLFSIEGNLTRHDLYFTGKAASHSDPAALKSAFLKELDQLAQGDPTLARYRQAVDGADPRSLWELALDTIRTSEALAPGEPLRALGVSCLYYWNPENTNPETAIWIRERGLANRTIAGASHWPMIDDASRVAAELTAFFNEVYGTPGGRRRPKTRSDDF
ncbi:alpha/beta fold hydrolase [Phyllobacterium sophorae]|nr:alpha/beta hydrolase [Phyllobacterium sophorae]